MAQATNLDFFDKAKGFRAAFNQVRKDGFFESMTVEVRGVETLGTTHVSIKAEAFLPKSKEDMAPGVAVFVSPERVVKSIREQLRTNKFKMTSYTCEVKSTDWHKLGKDDAVIGTRGIRLSFHFMVYMKPKIWED